MTKKKVTTTTVEDDTGVPEGNEPTPDDVEMLRDLAEIEEAGAVRWNIHRTQPIDKAGYCMTCGTGDLRLDVLADRLGPGKYRIRGNYPDGSYAAHRTVTIADDVVRKSQAAPAGGSVAEILAVLDARRADRSDAALKWAAILAPIVAAIIPQVLKPGTSLADLTTALANMKSLQPEPTSQLDTFIRGIEAAKGLGDKSGDTTWLDVLRDAARPLVEKFAGAVPASTPALASPSVATPNTLAASHTEGNPMLQLVPWFRATLATLIEHAKKNKDPELYAEVTLDNLPEGLALEKLREYITRDDWFQVLQQFHAGVAPYEGWFTKFRDAAVDFIDSALQPDGTPAKDKESATP